MGLQSLIPSGGSGLPLTGGALTGPLAINGGTVTDSTPLLTMTQTWNDVADAFHLDTANVTNTASKPYSNTWADASTLINRQIGGVTKFAVVGVGSEGYPMIRLGGTDRSQTLLKGGTGQVIIRLSDAIDMVSMGFHSTQFGLTVADNFAGGVYKGVLGFNGSTNVMGAGNGTADAFFTRAGAAAAIQMGLNSAAPIDQLFKGPNGSGTNIVGGDLSIGSGQSTGNATPALLRLQGTTSEDSGTTAQSLVDHLLIGAGLVEIENSVDLQLGNEAVAETPTASHTVIIKDSTGTSYKVLCVPI